MHRNIKFQFDQFCPRLGTPEALNLGIFLTSANPEVKSLCARIIAYLLKESVIRVSFFYGEFNV